MIKVLQINLHHCIEASASLLVHIIKNNIDIVLIQEPWVNQGKICGLEHGSYNLYYSSNNNKFRTCILCRRDIGILLIAQYSCCDQTVVRIETQNGPMLLTSAYFPHDEVGTPPPKVVCDLIEYSTTRKMFTLIGCDANSHHTFWGSTDTNSRGESLLDFIIENNLAILNKGSEPTFETRNRKEVLDITLCTRSKNIQISDWKVVKEISFSDHKYIEFKINIGQIRPSVFRNPKRANWDKFVEIVGMSNNIENHKKIQSQLDIELAINSIVTAFSCAFKQTCPISRNGNKKKNPPWWNSDLKKIRKEVRTKFNQAKNAGDDRAWSEYKDNLRHFKKELKKSKRQALKDMTNELNNIKDTSRLRKILSKDLHVPSNLQSPGQTWTHTSEETLKLLFEIHFPGCTEAQTCTTRTFVYDNNENTERKSNIRDIITIDKLEWAVNSFSPYKSPGLDGIYPIMLQKSFDIIGILMMEIYQACLDLQYFPTAWKETKVVFIPKAGKIQHFSPKDYRPISLSSFFLKTFERIIDDYIKSKFRSFDFSHNQHAYLKGKSVETALSDVVCNIEKSLHYKEYTLASFLDIEGAFNNIYSDSIHEALVKTGIESDLVNWLMQMLLDRQISASIGHNSMKIIANRGTPQGGVLSPTLWILVLNEVLLQLENTGVHVVAYADDLVLLSRGKFLDTVSNVLESALTALTRWSRKSGLNVNPSKTELVLFTNKRVIPNFRLPTLDGVTLKLSDSAKFLGTILDSKLNWKNNIIARVKKAYAAFYSCQKIIGTNWGLKPKLIHWMYTAIIRPILSYGSIVWWTALDKACNLKEINKIHRISLISITGAFKTTATASLEIILNVLPIDLYIKETASKSAIRLSQSSLFKKNSYGHSNILGTLIGPSMITDYIIPYADFNKKINTCFPTREQWERNVVIKISDINVYTDGSKMDTGTGCGIFCEKLEISESIRLKNECTVFQAEVFAVAEAARLISMRALSKSDITIFIDSQAAIKAIESRNIRSEVVSRCRQELQVLNEQHLLKLCWVPGHNNILGNEKADELARNGSNTDIDMVDNRVKIPLAIYKQKVTDKFQKLMIVRWEQSNSYLTTKQTWGNLKKNNSKTILGLNKNDLRSLIGVLTGHNPLCYHLKRMGFQVSELCRWCGGSEIEEDSFHFLCQCPALSQRRHRILGAFLFQNLDDIEDLHPMQLIKFLKSADWQEKTAFRR